MSAPPPAGRKPAAQTSSVASNKKTGPASLVLSAAAGSAGLVLAPTQAPKEQMAAVCEPQKTPAARCGASLAVPRLSSPVQRTPKGTADIRAHSPAPGKPTVVASQQERPLTARATTRCSAPRPSSPVLRTLKGAGGATPTRPASTEPVVPRCGSGASSSGKRSAGLEPVTDSTGSFKPPSRRLCSAGQNANSRTSSDASKDPGVCPVRDAAPVDAAPTVAFASSTSSELGEDTGDCSVVVAVRVRPFTQRELDSGDRHCAVVANGNDIVVTNESGQTTMRYTYDYAFSPFSETHGVKESSSHLASQAVLYEALGRPLLAKAIEGYNVCLFAYGQTGSGKSFSIMGTREDEGIIPRFSRELFEQLHFQGTAELPSSSAEISFFEIYNEKIYDLLAPNKGSLGKKKATLKVREHPQSGPYVEGLSSFVARCHNDIMMCLDLGNKQRATAATGMNDKSSRSHSVFTVFLSQRKSTESSGHQEHSIVSRINIVDLAGSERQSSAQTSGQRLKEGASINKSLLALGTVINLLAEHRDRSGKNNIYIPYRDSSLTWLLKDSLGGNSHTAMLATVSPSSAYIDESQSTLRYASRARSIVNVARINEDPNVRLIRELREEIERLKLASRERWANSDSSTEFAVLAEISALKRALQEKELEVADMQRMWEERLQTANAATHVMEESALLEIAGIAPKADNRLPSLVNLSEDPQLSEVLSYVVKKGLSKVGRWTAGNKADIQLMGALIADEHCLLKNDNGLITIAPISDSPTYVNGELIVSERVLHHADRVVIGGSHYFRFQNPSEASASTILSGQQLASSRTAADFTSAQCELLRVQNERMLVEQERLREDMRHELDSALAATESSYESRLNEQRQLYEGKIQRLEKDLEAQLHAEKLARDQKLSLEREVLENRREAQALADQTNAEAHRLGVSLVQKLAAEKARAELSRQRIVEKLEASTRSRTAAMTGLETSAVPFSWTQQSTDGYRLPVLIREANQICCHLGKPLVFSMEYLSTTLRGNAQQQSKNLRTLAAISVTNKALAVLTFWSVEKFESRLLDLREAFMADGDSQSTDFDNAVESACDRWLPLSDLSENLANKENILKELLGLEREESKEEPQDLVVSPRRGCVYSQHPKGSSSDQQQATLSACEDVLRFTLRKSKGAKLPISALDQLLLQCELIMSIVNSLSKAILGIGQDNEQVSAAIPVQSDAISKDPNELSTTSVQLVSAVHTLLGQARLCGNNLWSGYLGSHTNPMASPDSTLQHCLAKLEESVVKLISSAVLLLQGIRSHLVNMVSAAVKDISDATVTACSCIGTLSLITETELDCAFIEKIGPKLSKAVAFGLLSCVMSSTDDVLLSLRNLLCSLKAVHKVRPKDIDVSSCMQLLEFLSQLLTSIQDFTSSAAADSSSADTGGSKIISSVVAHLNAENLGHAMATTVQDCWNAQQCYSKWLRAATFLKDALSLIVKPILHSGSEFDRGSLVNGAINVRQALDLFRSALPSGRAAMTVLNLIRQIDEQIGIVAPSVQSDVAVLSTVTAPAARFSTSGLLADVKRRVSCVNTIPVSKLTAIFDK